MEKIALFIMFGMLTTGAFAAEQAPISSIEATYQVVENGGYHCRLNLN